MTESAFLDQVEKTLQQVETWLDDLSGRDDDGEIEVTRSGHVLTIELFDNNGTPSKIIISVQTPMKELWLASKSGGFHYRWKDGAWKNTRDGSEFFSALSRMVDPQNPTTMQVF